MIQLIGINPNKPKGFKSKDILSDSDFVKKSSI